MSWPRASSPTEGVFLISSSAPGCPDRFQLVTSQHIVTEFERTFQKPYFAARLSQEHVQANLDLLRRRATLTALTVHVAGVATHPEDDRILATAVSAQATYLVTGDGPLRAQVPTYQSVALVSPREFRDLLEQQPT
jgi:putative PIN family toxin of toxin-antitoxin system